MHQSNFPIHSRREFLSYLSKAGIAISFLGVTGCKVSGKENSTQVRRFHVSMQEEAWIENPELITILKNAEVTDIWMASFLQGSWSHTSEELRKTADY